MPTRRQVRRLLEQGLDHAATGRRLGIPAGLAHMIATGVPADGSDTLTEADRQRTGAVRASQSLAQPPPANPLRSELVPGWINARIAEDDQLRQASARRSVLPEALEHAGGDVAETVTREHNKLQAAAKRLSALPAVHSGASSAQIRSRWTLASWIARQLVEHEEYERTALWPLVREHLHDGPERAEDGRQRAQDDERLAGEVLECAANRFEELAEQLLLRVRQHAALIDRVCLDLRTAAPEALRPEDHGSRGEDGPARAEEGRA